jgi:hypothetical protein
MDLEPHEDPNDKIHIFISPVDNILRHEEILRMTALPKNVNPHIKSTMRQVSLLYEKAVEQQTTYSYMVM